jgi:MarR-like DNA-binding transcriptional regulator SgrR of sgrS sRNA
MPEGMSVRKIEFHRERADLFLKTARQRHRRAAALAQQALAAQRQRHPVQAQKLMESALQVKAAAGRASLRSQYHRARIAEIKRAQRAARLLPPVC